MGAALTVVKVAEDVAVTLDSSADEVPTGAAMAKDEVMSAQDFLHHEKEQLTSADGEGGENELEEVHHLCGGLSEKWKWKAVDDAGFG